MFVVRGTRRFLDHAGGPTATEEQSCTSVLGDWYATVLAWWPEVALFVNETTLLPVFTHLAPAHAVVPRFPGALAEVLTAHRIDPAFITAETTQMTDAVLAPTRNRSVVGIMNEFSFLAAHHPETDLLTLSTDLAAHPAARSTDATSAPTTNSTPPSQPTDHPDLPRTLRRRASRRSTHSGRRTAPRRRGRRSRRAESVRLPPLEPIRWFRFDTGPREGGKV